MAYVPGSRFGLSRQLAREDEYESGTNLEVPRVEAGSCTLRYVSNSPVVNMCSYDHGPPHFITEYARLDETAYSPNRGTDSKVDQWCRRITHLCCDVLFRIETDASLLTTPSDHVVEEYSYQQGQEYLGS